MPINAELFRQIADVIETHPDNYDQTVWAAFYGLDDSADATGVPHTQPDEFACGTRCCIAGFAVALTPIDQRPKEHCIPDAASTLLGLSCSEATALFKAQFSPIGMSVSQALRKIADTGTMLDRSEFTFKDVPHRPRRSA